jgi:hypothetical protein
MLNRSQCFVTDTPANEGVAPTKLTGFVASHDAQKLEHHVDADQGCDPAVVERGGNFDDVAADEVWDLEGSQDALGFVGRHSSWDWRACAWGIGWIQAIDVEANIGGCIVKARKLLQEQIQRFFANVIHSENPNAFLIDEIQV